MSEKCEICGCEIPNFYVNFYCGKVGCDKEIYYCLQHGKQFAGTIRCKDHFLYAHKYEQSLCKEVETS